MGVACVFSGNGNYLAGNGVAEVDTPAQRGKHRTRGAISLEVKVQNVKGAFVGGWKYCRSFLVLEQHYIRKSKNSSSAKSNRFSLLSI